MKRQSASIALITLICTHFVNLVESQYIDVWSENFEEEDRTQWSCGNGGTFSACSTDSCITDWTQHSCYLKWYDSTHCANSPCAVMCAIGNDWENWWFERSTNITAYSRLLLEFDVRPWNINDGSKCQVWYSYDGAAYNKSWEIEGNGQFSDQEAPLGPTAAANTLTIRLQIYGNDNNCDEACYFDNVILKGVLATNDPTQSPTNNPSKSPTVNPTTNYPTTHDPSSGPTNQPSISTQTPTSVPTKQPSSAPTKQPTAAPTDPPSDPTQSPSKHPTALPTSSPTNPPSLSTQSPSDIPTNTLTHSPTQYTNMPTQSTHMPSATPTAMPVTPQQTLKLNLGDPTMEPTNAPLTSVSSDSNTESIENASMENSVGTNGSMMLLIGIGAVIILCLFICLCIVKTRRKRSKTHKDKIAKNLPEETGNIQRIASMSNDIMMTNMQNNNTNYMSNTSVSGKQEGIFGANLLDSTAANNVLMDDVMHDMDDDDDDLLPGVNTAGGDCGMETLETNETPSTKPMNMIHANDAVVGAEHDMIIEAEDETPYIGSHVGDDDGIGGDYQEFMNGNGEGHDSDEDIMDDINGVTAGGPGDIAMDSDEEDMDVMNEINRVTAGGPNVALQMNVNNF